MSMVVALSIGLAALPARAEWHAMGEAGASFAGGNSENEAVNTALEIGYRCVTTPACCPTPRRRIL
jgi:hypothetical protein